MRLRSLLHSLLLVLSPVSLLTGVSAAAQTQRNFSVSEKTDVPGQTLSPGIYSIQVVDHLSDRIVVRIQNTDGSKPNTFLSVNGASLPGGDGPVAWAQGSNGHKALRGFRFPGGLAVEFVYPKAEAVALAKANSDHVIAIDPASEGRAEGKLSGEDMQLVNLWMLSPVKVGPEAGIKAQKYQQVAAAETRPDLLGRNGSPAPAPASTTSSTPVTAQATPEAPPVRPHRKPVVAKLPHTASNLPLVWMLGMFSLVSAAALRLRRA